MPPSGTLGELVRSAFVRAEALSSRTGELERSIARPAPAVSLRGALDRDAVAVIAEVKRASPSAGTINTMLSAGLQARAYETGGAAAVSVLTEPDRFGGGESDIANALSNCRLPILKKDFHVAEVQFLEAKALGSSAALLIVRALHPDRVLAMARFAREIGLEVLFEIRDERELDVALGAGATIIGVNNRNLETLEVDAGTVSRIVPLIPCDCVAVAESGYRTVADVEGAARAGADAVLVGSILSASNDPAAAVGTIAAVPRVRDVR